MRYCVFFIVYCRDNKDQLEIPSHRGTQHTDQRDNDGDYTPAVGVAYWEFTAYYYRGDPR